MKKLLYVLGASYSGTTMLDYMLGNSPVGYSCGECYALFRPFRPHHKTPDCTCGNPTCGRWDVWMQYPEQFLYNSMLARQINLQYLVDSSKNVDWIKSQMSYDCDRDYYFIVVYKNPNNWMKSIKSRQEDLNLNSYAQVYNSYLSQFSGKNIISVNLENLLANPANVLKKICDKCGIQYVPGQEKFWTKEHHAVFGSDSARLHLAQPGSPEFNKVARRIQNTKNGTEPIEIKRHRKLYASANKASYDNNLPENVAAVIRRLEAIDVSKGV